jgi:hypothetical protein
MSQETEESPLLKQYGRAVIDGNEWKDSTSYSQNGKKVPTAWEARFGHFRIVLLRRASGEWTVFSYHPVTKEWKLSSQIVCPEIAAHYATKVVIEWLRDLADQVEKSGKYAATPINEKAADSKAT